MTVKLTIFRLHSGTRHAKPAQEKRPVPNQLSRNPLPPLPTALLAGTPNNASSNNEATRWKLAGIIEFAGEKTALLEHGGNPQDKATVFKKVGETIDPGGWKIAEVQSDRVLLTRQKTVSGKTSGGAVERLTLTIGQ